MYYDIVEKTIKGYRVLPRRIAGLLNLDETYVYMWLCFKSDYNSGKSKILRETLCNCTDFKDVETITNYTNKFRDLFFLEKHGDKFYDDSWKTANEYTIAIPQTDWIRIKYDLLQEDISREIKSFLVLLKCLCLNNTNICLYNYTEISKRLNLHRATVSSYIKRCIDLGKVKELYSGFLITDANIIADPRKDGLSKSTQYIYKVISDYCISKGIIPPKADKKILDHIYCTRYMITEEDLVDMLNQSKPKNKVQIYKAFSLKSNLETKCKNLPSNISSLKYFSDILLGETNKKQKAQKEKSTIVL